MRLKRWKFSGLRREFEQNPILMVVGLGFSVMLFLLVVVLIVLLNGFKKSMVKKLSSNT